jgi:ribosome-binding factor A
METTRQKKFAKEMQRELSAILQRDIDGLRGVLITVSRVQTSPDLQHVKAYITVFPEQHLKTVLTLLKEENHKVRQVLAGRIKDIVRVIPELDFRYDDSLAEAARMDELFTQIRAAESKKNDEPSE